MSPAPTARGRGVRRCAASVALATLALGVAIGTGLGTPAVAASEPTPPVRRVLVFSLPHVTWADLDRPGLPTINGFLDRAAVAGLTTRVDARATKLSDGYLTLGAGTRTIGDPATDGDVLGVDEPYGEGTAGEAFEQRTGRVARMGIVALAMPRVIETNGSLLYDSEPGALGVALRDAGIDRAVIANADGRAPDSEALPEDPPLRRQAGLALVDPKGRIPQGRVDAGLLQVDRDAPFGVRSDLDTTAAAFAEAWSSPRAVVLVEASDLVREDRYRPFATPHQRTILLRRALKRSDELLARLLADVDPTRDAVVVVGPAHAAREIDLTVLGIQAPTVEPGLLRTATTRRSGFVQMVDVAPTILDLVGVPAPSAMEGRAAEVGSTGGSADDRRALIVYASEAAVFRDRLVGPVQAAAVGVSTALTAGIMVLFGTGRLLASRQRVWRDRLGTLALCLLGFVTAVFLVRLAPLHEVGLAGFWAFLVVVSFALGLGYHRLGRHRPVDAVLIGLLVPAGVLLVDVLLGTPLQFNSPLGYSPTVAGRFIGFSNPAYAAVAACVVIAAPLLAARLQERRGPATSGLADGAAAWIPIALLAFVVVVDGSPLWGSDVGGILSMVPAFAITALLILGVRVRVRAVAWCAAGLVVALVGFTALDLSRPSERRTHLGRLVERVDERGIGDFFVVVQRKLGTNIGSFRTSIWGVMLLIVVALALWSYLRAPDRIPGTLRSVPGARVAATGLAIVAVLGALMNDSGVAIPGVMLVIALATLTWLLVRFDPEAPVDHERGAADVRPVSASRS